MLSLEEADTTLMLHLNDYITCFDIGHAIIWFPDTNIFLVGIHSPAFLASTYGLKLETKH